MQLSLANCLRLCFRPGKQYILYKALCHSHKRCANILCRLLLTNYPMLSCHLVFSIEPSYMNSSDYRVLLTILRLGQFCVLFVIHFTWHIVQIPSYHHNIYQHLFLNQWNQSHPFLDGYKPVFLSLHPWCEYLHSKVTQNCNCSN